jgi:hypothetical protein
MDNHGKNIGIPMETMGKHKEHIGKPWENHGRNMGKPLDNPGKNMRKPLEKTLDNNEKA